MTRHGQPDDKAKGAISNIICANPWSHDRNFFFHANALVVKFNQQIKKN